MGVSAGNASAAAEALRCGAAGSPACALGVKVDHATPVGFRVTVERWVADAYVAFTFDDDVSLGRFWGSVKPVDGGGGEGTVLTFALRGAIKPPANGAHGRTDQWGFALDHPYKGGWHVACAGALPPWPPPHPPPSMAESGCCSRRPEPRASTCAFRPPQQRSRSWPTRAKHTTLARAGHCGGKR